MKIPRKQPVQTKAQVRHAFTQFLLLYESVQTHYGHEIDAITGNTTNTVFLKWIGSARTDQGKAAML